MKIERGGSSLPEPSRSRTTVIVALGMLLGAVVGYLTTRGRTGSIIGALIGAAGGGAWRSSIARLLAPRPPATGQTPPKDSFKAREATLASAMKDASPYEWWLGRSSKDELDFSCQPELKLTKNGAPWGWDAAPTGNTWSEKLGQSNYAVVPFSTDQGTWVSVGVEHVVRHPTGGAYPVVHGYMFRYQPGEPHSPENVLLASSLRKLADALDPDPASGPKLRVNRTVERVATDQGMDAAMLRLAADSLAQGRLFCLRTLLLSKDSHPRAHLANLTLPDAEHLVGILHPTVPQNSDDSEAPDWTQLFQAPQAA